MPDIQPDIQQYINNKICWFCNKKLKKLFGAMYCTNHQPQICIDENYSNNTYFIRVTKFSNPILTGSYDIAYEAIFYNALSNKCQITFGHKKNTIITEIDLLQNSINDVDDIINSYILYY